MKVVVISGYFNPLHGGHLDLIESAKKLGDLLVVLVNHDGQALRKKGKIILDQNNRLRLIRALRDVDEAYITIDGDQSVSESLKSVARAFIDDEIIFANGGDRKQVEDILEAETCNEFGIKMVFGVGGDNKTDSSTRISEALGDI